MSCKAKRSEIRDILNYKFKHADYVFRDASVCEHSRPASVPGVVHKHNLAAFFKDMSELFAGQNTFIYIDILGQKSTAHVAKYATLIDSIRLSLNVERIPTLKVNMFHGFSRQ